MEMDANSLAILLGIAGNLSTDTLKMVWFKATSFLSPKTKETAKLIEEGKKDDTTANQQKELQSELIQIMQKPELQELLKSVVNEAQINGNENIIIQNATIKQENQIGDNIIGNIKR